MLVHYMAEVCKDNEEAFFYVFHHCILNAVIIHSWL